MKAHLKSRTNISRLMRRGGAEAQDRFNVLTETIAAPVAESRSQRGIGFAIGEGQPLLTHVIGADNAFLFAANFDQCQTMCSELTYATHAGRMPWKLESSEYMCIGWDLDEVDACFSLVTHGAEHPPLQRRRVAEMNSLGTKLDA